MGFFNNQNTMPYNRYPQPQRNQVSRNQTGPYSRSRAAQPPMPNPNAMTQSTSEAPRDYGPYPFAINIDEATKNNNNFRTTLWTGPHLQVTLMSILPGEDIGLEMHPDLDQFIRIEDGEGLVMMGDSKDRLTFRQNVMDDFAFVIPAGKWHNLINTGTKPIKLYSIYAPTQHPYGTVHPTKADAEAAEKNH